MIRSLRGLAHPGPFEKEVFIILSDFQMLNELMLVAKKTAIIRDHRPECVFFLIIILKIFD
jgi:hypothetical protein